MQKKAFVLLSGGLDSTTALYLAINQFHPSNVSFNHGDSIGSIARTNDIDPWVEAVSIDYGQRHKKETEYAKRTCARLGIVHTTLSLGDLLSGVGIMLTDKSVDVPDISYSEIKGVSPTYVPFRNGLMLAAITAHAQKYVNSQIEAYIESMSDQSDVPEDELIPGDEMLSKQDLKELGTSNARDLCGIYAGMHAEDAANFAYPDCTPEFLGPLGAAINVGTYYTCKLHTPFQWMTKGQIVKWGTELGVPYEGTWSCYKGEELHCGICPTCRSRKDAFKEANVPDPTDYRDIMDYQFGGN